MVNECYLVILLKNSLSGEKGGRVENVGLHNRATFNNLDSRKESPYPEKISFRVFQQNLVLAVIANES